MFYILNIRKSSESTFGTMFVVFCVITFVRVFVFDAWGIAAFVEQRIGFVAVFVVVVVDLLAVGVEFRFRIELFVFCNVELLSLLIWI